MSLSFFGQQQSSLTGIFILDFSFVEAMRTAACMLQGITMQFPNIRHPLCVKRLLRIELTYRILWLLVPFSSLNALQNFCWCNFLERFFGYSVRCDWLPSGRIGKQLEDVNDDFRNDDIPDQAD